MAQNSILIRPGTDSTLDVAELWRYRQLLYFLAWRDLKVRYRQTALGVAWVLIQPLAGLAIFTLLFSRIDSLAPAGVSYPVFVFAGLWPWTFFVSALISGANSVVSSAGLLTRVYFPRLILPGAAVAGRLLDLALAVPVLLLLMLASGVPLTWRLLGLPLVLLFLVLVALALGTWLSAVAVRYRDVIYALPFLLQIGLFATPIVYPLERVPERWRWVLWLNPMTGVVEAVRACVLGLPSDGGAILATVGLTLALLAASLRSFRRRERQFADVV